MATARKKTEEKPAEGKETDVLVNSDVRIADLFSVGRSAAETETLVKASIAPKVTTFMARKINLGNFENVDFSFSVQVPLGLTAEEKELFNAMAVEALQQGIDVVKPEINERTRKILKQLGRIAEGDEEA